MLGRALTYGLLLAATFAALPVGPARAANLWDLNFYLFGPSYDGAMPPCHYPSALDRIQRTFSQKENFWISALAIVGFDKVRETAYRPWAPNAIPRRFCSAIAEVSDGSRHPIYYSIGEDTGMIGATWGVEWCVVGLDRNWAYNPSCKMARP